MKGGFIKWIREHYNRIINSIAFYPAFISLAFVFLSWVMLQFDFSEEGKNLKLHWGWLRLQDADTARNIAATIAAGILSLTVFSFSMVMIVMTQAASQMSNRLLESMIGNRLQQVVLGFYIGTIVYALLLLTSIRAVDSGVHVPALSVYLLMFITIGDIFLFISFLHYVTQSVKYETIINRIRRRGLKAMESMLKTCSNFVYLPEVEFPLEVTVLQMKQTGYYQGFNLKMLMQLAQEENLQVRLLHSAGTFLLHGAPLLQVSAPKLDKEPEEKLYRCIDVFTGERIEQNYYYGFRHLTEVAVKALSPGINDPSTAVHSLHALGELLAWRINNNLPLVFADNAGVPRIFNRELSVDELVYAFLFPVWDYGKNDRYVQSAFIHLLSQLLLLDRGRQNTAMEKLLNQVKAAEAGTG